MGVVTLGWRAPSGLPCGCQLKQSDAMMRELIWGSTRVDLDTNQMVFDGTFELVPCRLHGAAQQMRKALEGVEREAGRILEDEGCGRLVRACADALAAARPKPTPEPTPLRKYGQHLDICSYLEPWDNEAEPCNCGLDEALGAEAIDGAEKEEAGRDTLACDSKPVCVTCRGAGCDYCDWTGRKP